MSRKLKLIPLAALFLALLGAGCSQNQEGTSPSSTGANLTSASPAGTGLLSVHLLGTGAKAVLDCRDGSGRFIVPDSSKLIASLSLTFDSLRVYPAPADSDSTGRHRPPCRSDSAEKYIEVLTGPITVDATRLADTLSATLANANLPAGRYSHLAVKMSSATAVLRDSEPIVVHILKPDSLVQVLVPFTVASGQTTEIQLTIDLNRAVREIPFGSGEYYLQPVMGGMGREPHEGGPWGWGPGGGPNGGGGPGGGGPGGGRGHGPGGGHGGGWM